ncbi:MAG TPA: GAF domain-containing sensor histidine kinase [Candidatus Eisenbacteria bacterium]|nr:GAF domain-containing sensor histidine kinase [Candidatus Eisenbacteria bacterium]
MSLKVDPDQRAALKAARAELSATRAELEAARAEVERASAGLRALDAATRAISAELDLERVLQLMVDSLRDLVHAEYAALGIVDASGRIERFITGGVSAEERERIGAPPRGHGLLGTIIREGVSLRIADIKAHADSYGFPPEHPPMHSFLGVPVRVGGRPIGNFYLTEKRGAAEFTPADQELVEVFALHAGIAIQNARLHQRVQELAVVDERLRISRDLHDGIIQGIYAVGLTLEDVPDLMTEEPAEAVARVDRAIDRLNTTIRDIRTFIVGLGTDTGEDTLASALTQVAAELRPENGLEVSVEVADESELAGRLSVESSHELLQIAREALSNVVRHSEAARASMSLWREGNHAVLRVEDDGRGFDPKRRAGPGHFGLLNLHDRAASVGGTLEIDSKPRRGTRIIVRLPLLSREGPVA